MARKKVVERTQEAEGRPGYGSFLVKLAAEAEAGRWPALPKPAVRTPEEEDQITWRASDSVFSRRRMATLKADVAGLKAEVAALKRATNPARKCPLWEYVRAAKKASPSRASNQLFIAGSVDELIGQANKKLRSVCPATWKNVHGFPDLLTDAIKHPVLKGRVKSFISKVR